MKDVPVSNTLYWAAIIFMAIIFVATIILNSYIFVLDNQLTQQVYLSRVALQKATLIIDYGNGQRKIFEGDVPTGGLSLYDALLASAQTGSISVQFSKTADGRVSLVKIDQYVNNMDHYWELQIPKFNWKRALNDSTIDLTQFYLVGGNTAYLVYK